MSRDAADEVPSGDQKAEVENTVYERWVAGHEVVVN